MQLDPVNIALCFNKVHPLHIGTDFAISRKVALLCGSETTFAEPRSK